MTSIPPDDNIELSPPAEGFRAAADRRPRMEEPIAVNLITIDDAVLPAPAGLEIQLDEFYVGLLEFIRAEGEREIIYRADNFNLRFDVREPPLNRETLRSLGVEVRSLADTERKLIDREIPYTRQKSLEPGRESLLLLDPAGNWLELTECRAI